MCFLSNMRHIWCHYHGNSHCPIQTQENIYCSIVHWNHMIFLYSQVLLSWQLPKKEKTKTVEVKISWIQNCFCICFLFCFLWNESLNSDGHQFHQYQQNKQPLFTSNLWTLKITTFGVGNPGLGCVLFCMFVCCFVIVLFCLFVCFVCLFVALLLYCFVCLFCLFCFCIVLLCYLFKKKLQKDYTVCYCSFLKYEFCFQWLFSMQGTYGTCRKWFISFWFNQYKWRSKITQGDIVNYEKGQSRMDNLETLARQIKQKTQHSKQK
jgi:hypothetical protein